MVGAEAWIRPNRMVQAVLQPFGGGGTGAPRLPEGAATGGDSDRKGCEKRCPGPQPDVALAALRYGEPALPARYLGALHERPSGAGPASGEAMHEDLGGVPLATGSAGFRYVAQRTIDGVEAG